MAELPREDWFRLGEAHRLLRVASGNSVLAVAIRRGLPHRDVVDMEHGRKDPSLLIAPLLRLMVVPPERPAMFAEFSGQLPGDGNFDIPDFLRRQS